MSILSKKTEGGESLSLESAANLCREAALEVQKQKITTSAGFITLIAEQAGDIAKAYWHEGREAADIPEEVTDMIVVGLCYLNWLGLTNEKIERCFQNSVAKLKRHMEIQASEIARSTQSQKYQKG